MKYRNIAQTSLTPSVMGIGGLHFGTLCNQVQTEQIIHHAIDVGINFIDTAPLYGGGNSERIIGNALGRDRHKVLLATKVGIRPVQSSDGVFRIEVEPLTKKNIRSRLEASLAYLRTDYIDLYQLHAFDQSTPLEETFEVLQTLIQEGKIRYVGCSNYDHENLRTAAAIATKKFSHSQFVTTQCHYNLIERSSEPELLPTCRELGMSIICNRALARGILTGKYKLNHPIPKEARAKTSWRVSRWLTPPILSLVSNLEKKAASWGYSLTQLSLSWLQAQNGVVVVLVGARTPSQLNACIQAVNKQFSKTEIEEVDQVIKDAEMFQHVYSLPETHFET